MLLSLSIVLFWATSSSVAYPCWEGNSNLGEQSFVCASGYWAVSARRDGRNAATCFQVCTLHLKASLGKCRGFLYKDVFLCLEGPPRLRHQISFFINLLTPVCSDSFDWAEGPLSVLFEADIWPTMVTACPLCPPVQYVKNDDSVSDALCGIYALSWQCWFIYLFGCLVRSIKLKTAYVTCIHILLD